jgi:phage-related protein
MPARDWRIDWYDTHRGHYPAKDFIRGLIAADRRRIDRKIGMLRELGRDLRRPHTDYLRDGIHELRIKCGNKEYRLLYFIFERTTFVMLNGLLKKDGPVPDSDIDRAIDYMHDYIARKAGGR